jgi:hypothetical protein
LYYSPGLTVRGHKTIQMENAQDIIIALLKEATGKTDVSLMDYKNIDDITKDRVDFKRVRDNFLLAGRIKTPADVERMRQAFLALKLP